MNISHPLKRTHTCAYQGVRNIRFLENSTSFFSCYLRFEIRPFALLPTIFPFYSCCFSLFFYITCFNCVFFFILGFTSIVHIYCFIFQLDVYSFKFSILFLQLFHIVRLTLYSKMIFPDTLSLSLLMILWISIRGDCAIRFYSIFLKLRFIYSKDMTLQYLFILLQILFILFRFDFFFHYLGFGQNCVGNLSALFEMKLIHEII